MALAKGWDRESDVLFIHETGARISKTSYRGKMAWWFFPVSLDVPAVEHAPTDEGREDAFATSERELPKSRAKAKPKAKKKAAVPRTEDAEAVVAGDAGDSGSEEADSDDKDEDGE